MNKKEFSQKLESRLDFLPEKDKNERIEFYLEAIDDRIEEGLTEEEAVAAAGSIDQIVSQIIEETPLSKLAKKKIKPKRRLGAWEIVLLILGSPIWISLLAAVFVVVIAIYAVLWAVIISLWAVFAALVGTATCGFLYGLGLLLVGNMATGVALIGAGAVCAGVSIFGFFGCKLATKGTLTLTKKIAVGIKICFVGKGKAK